MVAYWWLARFRRLLLLGLILTGSSWTKPLGSSAELAASSRHLARRSPAQQEQSAAPTASGCDLLFAYHLQAPQLSPLTQPPPPPSVHNSTHGPHKSQLAHWCECQDSLPVATNERLPVGQHAKLLAINHLICAPDHLERLIEALEAPILNQELTFQIDYLAVSVIGQQGALPATNNKPPGQGQRSRRTIQVEQISFTYSVASIDAGRQAIGESSQDRPGSLIAATNLMAHFVSRLIEPSRLQSLSIVYDENLAFSPQHADVSLDLGPLLSPLTLLNRLELSFGSNSAHLLLNENMLKSQRANLKWLNLASNGRIEIVSDQNHNSNSLGVFGHLLALDHLNLQSNKLYQFNLAKNFKQNFQYLTNSSHAFTGHLSLSTLNLARNKLSSLSDDLLIGLTARKNCKLLLLLLPHQQSSLESSSFVLTKPGSEAMNIYSEVAFLLPSLNQLDLSYNRINSISIHEASCLLCLMPNLMQLYLQHNSLIGLNLNYLLTYSPQTDYFHLEAPGSSQVKSNILHNSRILSSKLDLIDLSYNRLTHLSVINQQTLSNKSSVSLKSLNLQHNKLEQPISIVDQDLINRLIFEHTLNHEWPNTSYTSNQSSFDFLQINLNWPSDNRSICDFVSSSQKHSYKHIDAESMLNELLLNDNNINRINRFYFGSQKCKQIEELQLASNKLSKIEPESFDQLSGLRRLDLSNNLLASIEASDLFGKLIKLNSLNLSKNKLTQLKSKWLFSSLADLEYLDLSYNELTYIAWDLFVANQQLNRLDLSRNRLTHLDDASFSRLKRLNQLNLRDNRLKIIQIDRLVRSLMTVTVYSVHQNMSQAAIKFHSRELESNQPFNVGQKQDKKLSQQRSGKRKKDNKRGRERRSASNTIQMSHEEPYEEDNYGDSFQIGLNSNELESFGTVSSDNQCESLHDLSLVQVLDLSLNQLKLVESDTFRCLDQLKRLDLHSNRLKSLEFSAFRSMILLEHLNLADNHLIRLRSIKSLASNLALQWLDLSKNQINQLDASFFSSISKQTPSIRTLDLSQNPSLELQADDLAGFMDAIVSDSSSWPHSIKLNLIGSIKMARGEPTSRRSKVYKENKAHGLLNLEMELTSEDGDTRLFENFNDAHLVFSALRLANLPSSMIEDAQFRNFLTTQLKDNSQEIDIPLKLDLSNNNLTDADWTKLCHSSDRISFERLEGLNLSSNRLEAWPLITHSASELAQMKWLDLSRNQLGHLVESTFVESNYNMTTVEHLNLSFNALTSLIEIVSADYLNHTEMVVSRLGALMPSLRTIDLSHNRLTWLPNNLLRHWNNLKRINLMHNSIESLSLFNKHSSRACVYDLSHNARLKTIELSEQQEDSDRRVANSFDLNEILLTSDRQSGKFECNPLDAFMETDHSYQNGPYPDLRHGLLPNGNEKYSSCRLLERQTIELHMSLVSKQFEYHTLLRTGHRLLRVGLSNNELKSLSKLVGKETFQDINNQVIQMDLSSNGIDRVEYELRFCESFQALTSIDLSRNRLTEFPWLLVKYCNRLNYLNLAENHLERLDKPDKLEFMSMSNLLVLDLSNNQLKSVEAPLAGLLPRMRLLDLRRNHLRSKPSRKVWWPTIEVLLPDLKENEPRPKWASITASINSITINASEPIGALSIRLEPSAGSSRLMGANRIHSIKYCSLSSQTGPWSICLKPTRIIVEEICLPLRPVSNQSCTTDLSIEQNGKNNRLEAPHLLALDEQMALNDQQLLHHTNVSNHSQIDSGASRQQDAVLQSIDKLKAAWLSLKHFDLGRHITMFSRIQEESILFTINRPNSAPIPISTLSMLKAAVCLASVCIICLLLAMFSLLTSAARRANKRRRKMFQVGQKQEQQAGDEASCGETTTTLTATCHETNSSSTNRRDSSSQLVQSQTTCSSSARASSSSRNDQNTVIECGQLERQEQNQQVPAIIHKLHQIAAHPSVCLTPSLSLAPSSVETAETMQAVDSIKSNCSSITTLQPLPMQLANSVDQYQQLGTGFQERYSAGEPYANNTTPFQPAQVATVMRMIKSSSINAFASGSQPTGSLVAHPQARMRAVQERARRRETNYQNQLQQAIYVPHSATTACLDGYGALDEPRDTHGSSGELDPTTLSLLSLNSAISSALHANTSAGAQAESQPTKASLSSGPSQLASNLCHYHQQAALNQQRHQRSPLRPMFTLPPTPPPLPPCD